MLAKYLNFKNNNNNEYVFTRARSNLKLWLLYENIKFLLFDIFVYEN